MIIIVTTVACFTCGVIGYFVGWITTVDRQERRPERASEPASIVTASESDEFWEGVYAGSHARTSPRVTAGGGFPALPAGRGAMRIGNMTDPVTLAVFADYLPKPPEQAPLGELVHVHAGRTTDVIEKMKADTDRWLAANGLQEASSANDV